MLANLRQLVRYRGLIQTLVTRELKARYRGSILGFFWSFANPLLLLQFYERSFSRVGEPADFDYAPGDSEWIDETVVRLQRLRRARQERIAAQQPGRPTQRVPVQR